MLTKESEMRLTTSSETEAQTRDELWQHRLQDLEVVRRVVVESPLVEVRTRIGRNNTLLLKLESAQPNGSFKSRGPAFAIGTDRERFAQGVTANSRGNHSGGVALVGRELDVPVDIFLPADTPREKVDMTTSLAGPNFRLHNYFTTLEETAEAAQKMAEQDGKVHLPPYDDEAIIRGNGTLATETLLQLERQGLMVDGVHTAVGGGGLLSGLADVNHELGKLFDLYGAEPEGANSGTLSYESGHTVELSHIDTTAEGLAVRSLGALAHQRILAGKVDGMRTVNLASVGEAYCWYHDYALPELGVDLEDEEEVWRHMPEVSAMVAVAAALEHLRSEEVANETHLAIISGGNTDRKKAERTIEAFRLSRVSLGSPQLVANPVTQRAYVIHTSSRRSLDEVLT